MPSRRHLLTVLATATTVGTAGCSGSSSGGSDSVDCHTHALDHGDGPVLDGGAMATVEERAVRLAVPLSVAAVRDHDLDRLEVYDPTGDLRYTVPVSAGDADRMAAKVGVGEGQLRYEQYLGDRPFHGQYRIVAVDTADAAVDSVTIEFNCFPEAES